MKNTLKKVNEALDNIASNISLKFTSLLAGKVDLVNHMKTKEFYLNHRASVFDDNPRRKLSYARCHKDMDGFNILEYIDGERKTVLGVGLSLNEAFNTMANYEQEQEAKAPQVKTNRRRHPYYKHVETILKASK